MSLFNSLGSNYDQVSRRAALLSKKNGTAELGQQLAEHYSGAVQLTYKGREALVIALRSAGLAAGASVAMTGFTCYAVYKAVTTAGFAPHYLDINPASLNFGGLELDQAIKANPKIAAVIVQNTLGYPAEIDQISQVCEAHQLVLIEDLAHSVGATYPDGREAGTVGHFTMLSFGRDKLIDAVSGGAVVARDGLQLVVAPAMPAPWLARMRDRLYPTLTGWVRNGYGRGIGAGLHEIFKRMGLLSRTVDAEFYEPHSLPGWQSSLALAGFQNLAANLAHRREIAAIYRDRLDPKLQINGASGQIERATNLRFPILVDQRAELIEFLAANHLYVGDIWYDAAIAPPRYLSQTDYHGQCPQADAVAARILNLPTHREVTPERATQICEWINEWQRSQ